MSEETHGGSPDRTPFPEDRFRKTESVRERDKRARAAALDSAIQRDALDSMPESPLRWRHRGDIYFVVDESLVPSRQPEWRELPYLIHALRNQYFGGETIPEAEIPRELREVADRIDAGREVR